MSIFGAIGSLVGGLFSANAAKKQQQQLLQWQEHMSKNQVRFRVEDAKRAGVHPLAALGASLTSPSPTAIGTPDYSDMGQNIGRAIDATMTADDKADDYTKAVQNLNIERMTTENRLLDLQLANSAARTINQVGNPPTYNMPTPLPAVDDWNELNQASKFRVPGDPTRREVQEHNRWQDSWFLRSPGPEGQDYENAWQSAGEIPSALKFLYDIAYTMDQRYNKGRRFSGAPVYRRQPRYRGD